MRIAKIEDLHCDAGWRTWSFLKITTDDGVVGWSEYNESYGSRGLTAVIRKLGERLIGLDARPVERLTALMHAITRQAPGGLAQQAIAALENALVDVKARALGIPVAELLNGPVRERLRLYWSHCGSYRLAHAATMGTQPLRSLDDVKALGQRCASAASRRSRPIFSASTRTRPSCTSRASRGTTAGPSSTSTSACCGSSPTRWRRSARAPGPTSTCCSTSTSISRPRATSRSPRRSPPTA